MIICDGQTFIMDADRVTVGTSIHGEPALYAIKGELKRIIAKYPDADALHVAFTDLCKRLGAAIPRKDA